VSARVTVYAKQTAWTAVLNEERKFRWYPHAERRHGIDRKVAQGRTVTLCGRWLTVNPKRRLKTEPECVECDRIWRERCNLPQRPTPAEMEAAEKRRTQVVISIPAMRVGS
jgi:hypothetical protein